MRLLIFIILTQFNTFAQEENRVYNDDEAFSYTKKALLQTPEVVDRLKVYERKAIQLFGITEQMVPYLASTAIAIHGRITTKYFKGIKFELGEIVVRPVISYWYRDNYLDAQLQIVHSF